MPDEHLKCNICDVAVNATGAKQHAATPSHESHRAELEHELMAVRNQSYKNDRSVIVQWERSTSR